MVGAGFVIENTITLEETLSFYGIAWLLHLRVASLVGDEQIAKCLDW